MHDNVGIILVTMNVIDTLMILVHTSVMECKSKVHNDKEDIRVNVLMMECNSKVHSDKEDIGIDVFYVYLHNSKPKL